MICAMALGGAVLATAAVALVPFSTPATIATTTQYYGLSVADVNGDHVSDVFLWYAYGADFVRSNGAAGTFGAPVSIDSTASYCPMIIAADFRNNGYADVFVPDFNTPTAFVYPNAKTSTGSFGAHETLALPQYYVSTTPVDDQPSFIGTCDLNKDGYLDVIVFCAEATFAWWPSLGAASTATQQFGAPVTIAHFPNTQAYKMYTVACLDVNGDGTVDIVGSSYNTTGTSGHLTTLFSASNINGLGSFTQPAAFASFGSANVNTLVAVDLNVDGYMDVAVSTATAVYWYMSKTGTLMTQSYLTIVTGLNGNLAVPSLAFADFNGDGYPDPVIATTNSIVYAYNNPTQTFPSTFTLITTLPAAPLGLALGDFNGDGKTDFAYYTSSLQWVSNLDGCALKPCVHGNCTYNAVSPYYTCSCNPGYFGVTCANASPTPTPTPTPAICAVNNGGCSSQRTCTDSSSGTVCGACSKGYIASGDYACQDVDECQFNNGGCVPPRDCINTIGSYFCTPCPTGLTNLSTYACQSIYCAQEGGWPRTAVGDTAVSPLKCTGTTSYPYRLCEYNNDGTASFGDIQNVCAGCDPTCLICDSSSHCLECLNSTALLYNGNCLDSCPDGTSVSGSTCAVTQNAVNSTNWLAFGLVLGFVVLTVIVYMILRALRPAALNGAFLVLCLSVLDMATDVAVIVSLATSSTEFIFFILAIVFAATPATINLVLCIWVIQRESAVPGVAAYLDKHRAFTALMVVLGLTSVEVLTILPSNIMDWEFLAMPWSQRLIARLHMFGLIKIGFQSIPQLTLQIILAAQLPQVGTVLLLSIIVSALTLALGLFTRLVVVILYRSKFYAKSDHRTQSVLTLTQTSEFASKRSDNGF